MNSSPSFDVPPASCRRRSTVLLDTGLVLLMAHLTGCAHCGPTAPNAHAMAHADACAHLITAGQEQAAEARCRVALEYQDDLPTAHNGLGILAMNEGRTQVARAHFRAALRSDPSFADAWNNLGILEGRAGAYGKARDLIEEALRIDPGYAGGRANLAWTYYQTKDYEAVRREVDKCFAVDPAHCPCHELMVASYETVGNLTAALPAAEQFVAACPNSPRAHYVAGSIAMALGECARASDWFDHSVALRPNEAEYRTAAFKAKFCVIQHEGVEERIANAALRTDATADEITRYGFQLFDVGDYHAAYQQFERALGQSPHQCDAYRGAAEVSHRIGDDTSALVWCLALAACEHPNEAVINVPHDQACWSG